MNIQLVTTLAVAGIEGRDIASATGTGRYTDGSVFNVPFNVEKDITLRNPAGQEVCKLQVTEHDPNAPFADRVIFPKVKAAVDAGLKQYAIGGVR